MITSSPSFLYEKENLWEDLGNGVSRQVMGFNQDLMMVKFKFATGAIGAPHHHVHSQCAMVVSGVFELTIKGEKKMLSAGDGYFVEPGVEHSALCIEEGILVDAFNPLRNDFLVNQP